MKANCADCLKRGKLGDGIMIYTHHKRKVRLCFQCHKKRRDDVSDPSEWKPKKPDDWALQSSFDRLIGKDD